jgi:hypothetical protein
VRASTAAAFLTLTLTSTLPCCTSAKDTIAPSPKPYYVVAAELLSSIPRHVSASESPPDFRDCSPIFLPLLPIVCDAYSLSLWREDASEDLWVVEVGGIAGWGRRWYGPVDQDIPELERLLHLLERGTAAIPPSQLTSP